MNVNCYKLQCACIRAAFVEDKNIKQDPVVNLRFGVRVALHIAVFCDLLIIGDILFVFNRE